MSAQRLYGGIEGGGTKFICAVGNGPDEIIEEERFPTTTPLETIERVCAFFAPYIKEQHLGGIGLGSFGPVDTDPTSPTYGFITTTPKPNWANTNILGILKAKLGVPMTFDMDVVASAMGEYTWGASRGVDLSLYLTVGTGIGGSYILDGKPMRGLVSLEMGHLRIPHDFSSDPFTGSCPYHGDCFEGLASGPAIRMRLDQSPENIPDVDPFWALETDYIAYALTNYIFTFPPKIIILGGGVLHRKFLFAKIRSKVHQLLNNYLNHPILTGDLDEYIVPPALGNRSGVLGAIALAMQMK
jgi:fructokinase